MIIFIIYGPACLDLSATQKHSVNYPRGAEETSEDKFREVCFYL